MKDDLPLCSWQNKNFTNKKREFVNGKSKIL